MILPSIVSANLDGGLMSDLSPITRKSASALENPLRPLRVELKVPTFDGHLNLEQY